MTIVSPHIPFAQLIELVEGEISPDAKELAQSHLATCRQCAEELARLERVIGIMRRDTSVALPRAVVARAIDLFRAAHPSATFGLRRILATLRFDSAEATPLLALRAGEWRTRQLLFNAGDYDLDVRVSPSDDLWRIRGQVLGPCAGGLAELAGTTETVRTSLDELCTFSFPPAPRGEYSLTLRLTDIEVALPPLKLGE